MGDLQRKIHYDDPRKVNHQPACSTEDETPRTARNIRLVTCQKCYSIFVQREKKHREKATH